MSKQRRVPAGKLSPGTQPAPYALENEVLALLLGSSQDDTDAQVRRLRQRHPTLTEQKATEVVERCLQAKQSGYAIVARAVAQGDGNVHAAGRILEAHPWLDMRNLETICSQGFVLAIM